MTSPMICRPRTAIISQNAKRRRWLALPGGIIALAALLAVGTGAQIVHTSHQHATDRVDVAIVLGAAVDGDQPSPVFAERIRHGVALWHRGQVRYLLMTGGTRREGVATEASVARAMAVRMGVPADRVLYEDRSRTTYQNLENARAVMSSNDLRSAVIVSDPLHIERALTMANRLGIDAEGAPTPSTRIRSWSTWTPFLLREIWFNLSYRVRGG